MQNEYVEYKNIIRSLTGILGMGCFEFWDTQELHPAVMEILRWINNELVLSEPEEPVQAIRVMCDLIDQGNQWLLEGTFREETGVEIESDLHLGIVWANICTSLWESAKCNYSGVLWELEHQTCECQCGCQPEITEEDNLYSKLVGNGSRMGSGCGCGK